MSLRILKSWCVKMVKAKFADGLVHDSDDDESTKDLVVEGTIQGLQSIRRIVTWGSPYGTSV